VSLRAVVDEMEMLGEGMHAFLNRHTGELFGGTDEQVAKAEEGEDGDLLDWEVEIVHRLREVLGSPDWIELPQGDSHAAYRVMDRFCRGRGDGPGQEELLSAIRGRGALGRFREAISGRGLQHAWHAFRREALTEEARAWLEAHQIAFEP